MPKIIGDSIQQFHETDEQKQTDQDNLQKNLKDYLKRIQCQTALEIQCHVNEGTFVETNAVRKFIANAEKFDVFVIYGSKGVGKTCSGLEILRQFGEGYNAVRWSKQTVLRRCNIVHSLEKMDGTYLMYDAFNQSYKFKHQMVYEAVAISYFDIDPDTVIDVLTFEFISEMTNVEDNADFVNLLLKESETCTISDETDLSYLDNTVKIKFNFCSALLLYLTRKHNVDNSITVTLYFIERLIKDGIDQILVSSCKKKTILLIFDYLCATEDVDTISAFIVQPLTEWGIDCNFNEFIYRAIDNEKNNTASFLLQYLSQEINLVELIMNLDAVKKPRVVSIASETFKISSSCSYRGTDVTELIKWLITNTPDNTFNINNIVITSASKNLVSLFNLVFAGNQPFDRKRKWCYLLCFSKRMGRGVNNSYG
ncbi:unnamed protein product [Mytilus edulis]|uniref:Uncharacterized protein n=1 Tax=Mytilus edulis TaxID=6550 RepID=A0A8S3TTB4_MYTED|nr:unnamed protein product [Mytilus edulis]